MEWRGIRQTSDILGAKRNPEITEHGKTIVWNNTLGFFEYKLYWGGDFNTKTTHGIVYKGDDSTGASYVWKLDSNKNPFWRKEDFLVSAVRSGNAALFTMNDSASKTLPLGALAWLDTTGADITLPGDQKILFDDNDTIGGDTAFKYNKTTKTIDLTGFVGIQVKNGIDPSLKGAFQYLGRKNVLIGHGTTRSVAWATSMEGNILTGEGAGGSLVTGSWNVISGPYAGANISSNVSGSVFLGAYAGRLESGSNKLYVGNTSYASEALGRLGSLLYGDFSTGWLRVNNRLEVGQEARIGTFNIANTPSWGMLQFIGTGNPDEYKPQYHNGFNWVDFSTGANNYLSAVTKATADVGTTSDDYKITFVRNGLANLTLQLGSNAFNSLPIPKALPEVTYGFLQVSSGNTDDGNRGFTYSPSLSWSEANKRLSITGDVLLSSTALIGTNLGNIKFDGLHYYGYGRNDGNTANEWRRLDESGSSATTGVASTDPRIVITPNPGAGTNDFSLALTPTGSYITPATVKTYSGSVYGGWTTATGVAPEIKFKKIISNTIQFTENGDELIAEVTGAGGGESNAAENVGTGIGLYKDKVTGSLRFKSIRTIGSHITTSADADGLRVDLDVSDITLTNAGAGIPVIAQDAGDSFLFTQKTFVNGTATTATTSATEIQFDVNKEIPKFTFTPTPTYIPGNPGQASWILFKSDYSADIRTSDVLTSTTMFTLGIGAGLYYDAGQNTLSALNSAGSTSDYNLTSIVKVGNVATFHITDSFGGGAEHTLDLDLGTPIAAVKATYTDNITPAFGGVMINKSVKTTPLNSLQSLTLNEATGELGFSVEPVLLTPQYDLYDADNIAGDNLKRAIGRSNIGAAYVNGSATEDFNANVSVSTQVIVDTISTTEFDSNASNIQGIVFRNHHITSIPAQSAVNVSKRELVGNAPSEIEVGYGDISMTVNADKGGGTINFYTTTNYGIKTRVAFLDPSGNLHLKGEFITFDTTV